MLITQGKQVKKSEFELGFLLTNFQMEIWIQTWISFFVKIELELGLEFKYFFFKRNGREREEDPLVDEACVVWSFESLFFHTFFFLLQYKCTMRTLSSYSHSIYACKNPKNYTKTQNYL